MTETQTLLREYAEEGSERAFQELVERHIDLVYSTALRKVAGDSHCAADVTQMVFVRLSRQAGKLSREVRNFGGWLHRDACYVAAVLVRGEQRRRTRERQAVEMNSLHDEPDTNLTSVLPILDDAINELGDEDREAITLRFFEQQSFRAVGEIVGSSEDAARMRVNRALEKLHGLLRARGVAAVSVGALATILGTKAVSAAPIGLSASVVKGVGASATAGGGTSSAAIRTIAKIWKPAVALPVGALMVILGVGIYAGYHAANKPTLSNAPAAAPAAAHIVPRTEQAMLAQIPNAPTNAASNGMTYHVIDADSGTPLAGAKLRIDYIVPSNTRNMGPTFTTVTRETDSNGMARIDLHQQPSAYVDICVAVGGHVPMTMRLNEGEEWPTNYVMKLQPGTMVGGLVVDESGQPLSKVKIEFLISAYDSTKREYVNFWPDTAQYTDENGRWWSDMIPADCRQLPVILTHPDFLSTSSNITANSVDSANTVFILQKGISVRGTVVDLSGRSISGATVRLVSQARSNISVPQVQTDPAGIFELAHVPSGSVELSIQADGFSPVVLDSVVSNHPAALEVSLAPGHTLRGRVVDESGTPVANATIRTDGGWRGIQKIAWSAKTDADGKFEWNSAPAGSTGYSLTADGFLVDRESLRADETEHEVTLKRPDLSVLTLRIRGTAIDAGTGEPLDSFKALIGSEESGFRFATDGRNGQFDFRNSTRSGASSYQIEIQKYGYAPVASTNLLAKDGDQILAFELHKDSGFSGEVLLPNGRPAADAAVFLYRNGDTVHTYPTGEIQNLPPASMPLRTDGHGHFSVPAALDPRGLLVIHDQGYAEVPIGSFNGKIALQPWGRIEGKLLVGGNPGAAQLICLADVIYQSSSNSRVTPPLHLWRLARTDSDGNFVFDKVPPGERLVSQCFTRPDFGTITGYYETQEKPVTVNPGAVTHVELGGSGRTITGRVNLTGAADPIKWTQVAVELNLNVSGVPGELPPRTEDFTSYEAYDKAALGFGDAARAFWSSARGRELARSMRSYAAYCSADGSFSIPDVPPGQYHLKIDVRQQSSANASEFDGKEVGVLNREIDVPESEDGKPHEVLDLGTLEVPGLKPSGNAQANR
jgi:RNA polymerase sigma factor (sigma-70 family)